MESNELRTGNYVTKNGEIYIVDFITIRMARNYRPILLTKEKLLSLKLGFMEEYIAKKTSLFLPDYSCYVWFYKNGRIDLRINGIDFRDFDRKVYRYKYIHELQNLYFDLTKKELITKK